MKSCFLGSAVFALCGLCFTSPSTAQSVTPCFDNFADSIQFIAEPTSQSIRRFANGQVELFALDTVEPAAAAFNILILHPPRRDHFGFRECNVVGPFAGMDFAGLQASYDPLSGLRFTVNIDVYDAELQVLYPRIASIQVNQQTGVVALDLD